MIKASRYPGFVLAVVLSLAACGGDSDPTCVTLDRPAFMLEIRDSATNLPAALGATVVAFTTARSDSVTSTNQLTVSAGKGAGLFTVRVRQQGYALWSRSGILVPGSTCVPDATLPLLVRLQR
jgi:hypothetical protein